MTTESVESIATFQSLNISEHPHLDGNDRPGRYQVKRSGTDVFGFKHMQLFL